ncbi:hypothetical protein [Nocardia sp. NPDC127526]|uniref:hypothetical protein n=1 Tax=Nocardia sp. NPDC127526 TaxID=3345393 RepID=UPI0036336BED
MPNSNRCLVRRLAYRALITMIDGLGVLRAVRFGSDEEVINIAYDYASAELRIVDPLP